MDATSVEGRDIHKRQPTKRKPGVTQRQRIKASVCIGSSNQGTNKTGEAGFHVLGAGLLRLSTMEPGMERLQNAGGRGAVAVPVRYLGSGLPECRARAGRATGA